MALSDKIREFLSFGLEEKCEESVLNKILLINTFGLIALFTLVLFSVVTFFEGNYLIASLNLALSALVILNFLFVFKTHHYSTASNLLIGLISIYLLFQLVVGTGHGTVIFWFNIVPLVSIITLGLKRGSYFALFFLIGTTIILFLPSEILPAANFYLPLKLRFFGSYLAIFLISYIFEYYKILNFRNLERTLIEEKNENKSKEEFISRLSHQIRTPLNNIMLIGDMVSKDNLTEEQKDLMETILASASNLTNVVENISEISSLETRERPTVNIQFNLFATINNTLKLFSGQKGSAIQINLDFDNSIPGELIGDPVLLKQIFLNLIETILKRKSSGAIALKIVVKGKKIVANKVEVHFDLLTNKPVNLPLSESTFRFNAPRELEVSNVSEYLNLLELTIAKNIIEQNDSKLILKTTPDKSLIISFSLAFHKSIPDTSLGSQERLTEDIIIPESSRRNVQASKELKDSNVLLVEDNMINQKIVMLSLKKMVRNIDVANNGKEALDKFGTSKYDIILMDVQMPVMDGILATKKIREIESSTASHIPIIAITANALHGDKELCISAGMDDYIAKPFQVELLIEKMEGLLAKKD